ncbi:MAG: carboxypeptidase regulatory-like domain-containing protein [Opitutaceae bacterium]
MHCPPALRRLAFLSLVAAFLLAPGLAPAQSSSAREASPPATAGTVTGRIYNPSTGEYVRNAEVAVEGSGQSTFSGDGGHFVLTGVPPGEVTVTVRYTGYVAESVRLVVAPAATTRVDVNLTASLASRAGDTAIKLAEFNVSAEREGNAKAIMEQRRNLNISTSVASDVFGDVAQGNVGEFLKYLPGIDVDQSGVACSPMLGGLDPQYVGVAVDGVKLASADAFVAYGNTDNATAAVPRVPWGSRPSVVLSGIESIEISRTLSADMDADGLPGGST